MAPLPREAREGLLRAWIALLHEKQPGVTWVPVGNHDHDANRMPDEGVQKEVVRAA